MGQPNSAGPSTSREGAARGAQAARPVMTCVPEHVGPDDAGLATLARLRESAVLGLAWVSGNAPSGAAAQPGTPAPPFYLVACGVPADTAAPPPAPAVVHVFEVARWDMRSGARSPAQAAFAALLSEAAPHKVRGALYISRPVYACGHLWPLNAF